MEHNIRMSVEEAKPLVQKAKWYHSFELLPGLVTPGRIKVNPRAILNESYGLNESLNGKRILEIGTWDGPYAFDLESRGAEVIATDIQNPDHTGFNTAAKILGSKVEYIRTSVYELTKNISGNFDIVLFLGVFYHLKSPLLAFEQINQVLKVGGKVLFEGETFLYYAETLKGKKTKYRLLLSLLAHSDIPVTLSYPGHYKNSTNWFIPNPACLRSWLTASGFEVEMLSTTFPKAATQKSNKPKLFVKMYTLKEIIQTLLMPKKYVKQRSWGIARKTEKEPEIEHPLVKPPTDS